MPIHRLEEEPTRPAVLGDITCDSDGKVDAFIDRRDVKRTLLLHTFDGGDYYLGRSCWRVQESWETCTTCSATPTPCTSGWAPPAT